MNHNHSMQSKKSIQKELEQDKDIVKKFMKKYGAIWRRLSEDHCGDC